MRHVFSPAPSQRFRCAVAKGADDATIKAIPESFEVAEMVCHPAK